MKKLWYSLALIVLFTSCSLESEGEQFFFEVMPIESVDVPESFIFGETHEIGVSYRRTSTCHEFYDFIYDIQENERTIAVMDIVYVESDCAVDDELVTVNFNFSVTSTETYVFKFYQGQDDNGEDQYYLVEVPVEN